jgi:hypothetical protein
MDPEPSVPSTFSRFAMVNNNSHSPRSPLPTANSSELGEAPYPTSRNHAMMFLAQLLLTVPLNVLQGGIFMIRGVRREHLVEGRRWRLIE